MVLEIDGFLNSSSFALQSIVWIEMYLHIKVFFLSLLFEVRENILKHFMMF